MTFAGSSDVSAGSDVDTVKTCSTSEGSTVEGCCLPLHSARRRRRCLRPDFDVLERYRG